MDVKGLFVENVPFPYFILDRNFNVIRKSKQAEFVLPQKDFFMELIDSDYQNEAFQFLLDFPQNTCIEVAMNENKGKKGIYQVFKAADERSFYLHVYCIPLRTEITHFDEMIDTVERKLRTFNNNLLSKKYYIEKTLTEMKVAARMVDHQNNVENLAAGIAHEIRNPLTMVKGFLQLLKPQLKELGKDHYADVALDEINRANDIIYEFLNVVKPQSNSSQNIPLNKVVKDMTMLYESEALLRNIQITTNLACINIAINVPSNQLKQVLINLLKNAMEAIDDDSGLSHERKIYISTQNNSKHVFIDIKDSGCGMTVESQEKLFTPFFSTKATGTGIGLNVCKKIIEDYGGTIQVKSIRGKGTTFTIAFPIKTVSSL